MRATLTELFHVFLSVPLWAFAALVAFAVACRRSVPGTRAHRWRWGAAALAAVYYVACTPLVSSALERWLETRYPVPALRESDGGAGNTIVVLTAGWLRYTAEGHEQKMGEAGWERATAGIALWRRIGGRLLFTGAPTPDGRDSSAGAMARLARALGVPGEAILVEPEARNTYENLLYSKRMLGEAKGRVWLVTSALHMPRSVMAARGVGLEVTPYPCDFRADERQSWASFLPSNVAPLALERALHELSGMVAYRLKGWG